jgi:glycosyltransferase involved in cell wall biosynthesis
MTKKLSILTCTLHNRTNKFKKLNRHLTEQIKFCPDVELLANIDSGEKSIGLKRNELLRSAKGEYVVFIDDDDWVSDDYVVKILTAISYKNPDCCGIEGMIINRNKKEKFVHSIQYSSWYTKNNVHYRCPNHLNPIKRKIALSVGFLDISVGEDYDYSLRLKTLLKTEVYIKTPIYFYQPSQTQ